MCNSVFKMRLTILLCASFALLQNFEWRHKYDCFRGLADIPETCFTLAPRHQNIAAGSALSLIRDVDEAGRKLFRDDAVNERRITVILKTIAGLSEKADQTAVQNARSIMDHGESTGVPDMEALAAHAVAYVCWVSNAGGLWFESSEDDGLTFFCSALAKAAYSFDAEFFKEGYDMDVYRILTDVPDHVLDYLEKMVLLSLTAGRNDIAYAAIKVLSVMAQSADYFAGESASEDQRQIYKQLSGRGLETLLRAMRIMILDDNCPLSVKARSFEAFAQLWRLARIVKIENSNGLAAMVKDITGVEPAYFEYGAGRFDVYDSAFYGMIEFLYQEGLQGQSDEAASVLSELLVNGMPDVSDRVWTAIEELGTEPILGFLSDEARNAAAGKGIAQAFYLDLTNGKRLKQAYAERLALDMYPRLLLDCALCLVQGMDMEPVRQEAIGRLQEHVLSFVRDGRQILAGQLAEAVVDIFKDDSSILKDLEDKALKAADYIEDNLLFLNEPPQTYEVSWIFYLLGVDSKPAELKKALLDTIRAKALASYKVFSFNLQALALLGMGEVYFDALMERIIPHRYVYAVSSSSAAVVQRLILLIKGGVIEPDMIENLALNYLFGNGRRVLEHTSEFLARNAIYCTAFLRYDETAKELLERRGVWIPQVPAAAAVFHISFMKAFDEASKKQRYYPETLSELMWIFTAQMTKSHSLKLTFACARAAALLLGDAVVLGIQNSEDPKKFSQGAKKGWVDTAGALARYVSEPLGDIEAKFCAVRSLSYISAASLEVRQGSEYAEFGRQLRAALRSLVSGMMPEASDGVPFDEAWEEAFRVKLIRPLINDGKFEAAVELIRALEDNARQALDSKYNNLDRDSIFERLLCATAKEFCSMVNMDEGLSQDLKAELISQVLNILADAHIARKGRSDLIAGELARTAALLLRGPCGNIKNDTYILCVLNSVAGCDTETARSFLDRLAAVDSGLIARLARLMPDLTTGAAAMLAQSYERLYAEAA